MYCSVTEIERIAEEENVKKDETHDEVQSYNERKSMVNEVTQALF